jgi:hypothetical protein
MSDDKQPQLRVAKPADLKIADWIKSAGAWPTPEPARSKFNDTFLVLKREVGPSRVGGLLTATHEFFSSLPGTAAREDWWQLIADYKVAGCPKAAAALVFVTLPLLAKMPVEHVANLLPDAQSLEGWRKAAACSIEQLADVYFSNLPRAADGAGIAWLLANMPAAKLDSLFGFMLDEVGAGARRNVLVPIACDYLEKDPKGQRLEAWLACTLAKADRLKIFCRILRTSNETLRVVTETLALVAQSKTPGLPLGELVRCLFEDIHVTTGIGRQEACGRLARTGSALLLAGRLSPAGLNALNTVKGIGEELRTLARDPAVAENTWILSHLGQIEGAEGSYITLEGARRWAFAFEEAVKSGQNVSGLEVLGFNLGLRPLAELGQQTSYAPQSHDDIEGGILPGDPVITLSTGWGFNRKPVVRARVRRTSSL